MVNYAGKYAIHMGVSENSGTPKSSILIGFPIKSRPFWGTSIFGNSHMGMLIFRGYVQTA